MKFEQDSTDKLSDMQFKLVSLSAYRTARIESRRQRFWHAVSYRDLFGAGEILRTRGVQITADIYLAKMGLKFFYDYENNRGMTQAAKLVSLLSDEQIYGIAGTQGLTKYIFGVMGWVPYKHYWDCQNLAGRIMGGYGKDEAWDRTILDFLSEKAPYALRVCGARCIGRNIRNSVFEQIENKEIILEAMGFLTIHYPEKAAVLRLPSVEPAFIARALEKAGWQRTGFHVEEALKVEGLLDPEIIENTPEIKAVLDRARAELSLKQAETD